jgi:hypothetical protein
MRLLVVVLVAVLGLNLGLSLGFLLVSAKRSCEALVECMVARRWCQTVTPLRPFEESHTLLLFFCASWYLCLVFYCLDILVTKKNMKNK